MKKLTAERRKLICLIAGLIYIFVALNYYLDWRLFRGFDRQANGFGIFLAVIVLGLFGPRSKEIKEIDNNNYNKSRDKKRKN